MDGETFNEQHGGFLQPVDGSEIRLSPVEVGSLPYYFQGFSSIVVVWEFLNHQQYA